MALRNPIIKIQWIYIINVLLSFIKYFHFKKRIIKAIFINIYTYCGF